MKKRILSLLLTLAMCLSLGTFVLPQQAKADSWQTFDTSKTYFIWLKEDSGALNYRWNANGLGKKDVIHLDVPSGGNCVMTFKASEEAGYYGIRFEDRYVNTKDNNENTGQYLHQWEDFYEGGNQKFKFIPVEGEPDTYYIQMKKGGLYVGVQGNNVQKDSIIVTASDGDKCKWVVVSTEASFPTDKTQTFDTSTKYYLWLKDGKGDENYRWNANGTGQGDELHLDTPSGGNCKFTFTDAGDGYYGIKCKDRYVDTKDNIKQLGRKLHQWDKDLHQDNQKFRFIPVENETDTYYIQIKNNGLYVGLEGYAEPAENRNLVSADADHACQWVVIPSDPPPLGTNAKLPGAQNHVGNPSDGALTFMMNPLGYESGLSVNNDARIRGNCLHLWTMGHLCKVTAEYIKEDENGNTQDAYRIRSFDYFEASTSALLSIGNNFVWDVDGQSKNDGAVIHVWDQGSDSKDSTLWRFIEVPGQKDVYYIQNVRSHLYVGLDHEEDKDGVILKQTSKQFPWEIHWLYSGDGTKYYSYSVGQDGSVTDSCQGISPGNWMSRLPDNLPLSQINIPGTHDAAATRFFTADSNFINEGVGQILAQMLYLDEQLNAGVRAWDIRISNWDSSRESSEPYRDPRIIHGHDPVICHDRWGNPLYLSAVMDTARDFLSAHPKETIVMKIAGQGKGGDGLDFIRYALSRYTMPVLTYEQQMAIERGELTYDDLEPSYPIYIPSKEELNNEVPTLGDVRGKIVFLNGAGVPFHYAIPGDEDSEKIPDELDNLDEYRFRAAGPNIHPWVTTKIENDPPMRLQKIDNTCAWAQDTYNISDVSLKMEYVDAAFDDLSKNHQADSAYVLNFTSAADDIDVSKGIFKELRADKTLEQTSGIRVNTGLLFVNEIDPVMTRRIYMTNFDANDGTALPAAWSVFFDANGGSWSKTPAGCMDASQEEDDMITMLSQHMNAGGIASRPADPVRSGYVFQGWQLDGETYDFNTPVTKTITLTALWQKNSSGDSSGGGAAAVTHPVSVAATSAADAAAHGSVKASLANAKAGDKVTLTPQPDEGWQVTGVTVTDKNGREVSVTRNADGTYSFIMPDSKVEIAAVFAEIAEATEGRFVDVAADAWYAEAVAWAVERGIMNGVSETSFAPNDDTTRAMVVTMLWRLAGEPAASEPSGFSDVSDGAWYADAVAWATEAGAVTGMTADTFSPNTPVTREQLAAILYRYAQARGKGFTGSWMFLLDYPDAADISEWADEAMHWMVMHGVITGMDDGTMAPQDNATRAQIATMFMRFCGEIEK